MPAIQSKPQVVIVGGGFGGLAVARNLAKAPVDVTLIDRNNYHLFQPLLYQVATAGLAPGDIAQPIRHILRRQKNARVLMGEVTAIDPAARQVTLGGEAIGYDYLVLATGVRHHYFGHERWEAAAPGLKSIEDAVEIRRRIFAAYERAEREPSPEQRRALMTFVIVGGGPTGAELAGAIAEIATHTIARDFRSIDPRQTRIVLLEGGPHLLPAFAPSLSAAAQRQLERLGVEVITGAQVIAVDSTGVTLAGGGDIGAATVLWAAGTQASLLAAQLGASTDSAGRVVVASDCQVPGLPGVFAIGDVAHFQQDGRPLPGVARPAMDQGAATARNIARLVRGEPALPFRYHDKGSMATLGRLAGIAQIGPLRLTGFAAWLGWLLVHLVFLIGFDNRFLVLTQWAWSFWTYERGNRLITGVAALPGPRPEGRETTDLAPA